MANEPEKRGRGRPRRSESGDTSSNVITLRVTDDERRAYDAAAEAKGIGLAAWIRLACKQLLARSKSK